MMKTFAIELRENSEKVMKCDQLGIHCLDYVTELMTDPGAFDLLDGVAELTQFSLNHILKDPSILMGSHFGNNLQ